MKNYKIEIQELLSRIIEIEAPSAEEAIDKAWEMYRAEEIVFDADDWVGTEIDEFDEISKGLIDLQRIEGNA